MAAKTEGENDFKESSNLDKTTKMNEMFCRIVNKDDVNIKSQQRSETDLTNEQKIQILKDIFEQNPRTFLARFGKWISLEDLRCFCAASGSEMEYAVRILEKSLRTKASGVCVKNRRYEALQRLERESSYFRYRITILVVCNTLIRLALECFRNSCLLWLIWEFIHLFL